MLLSGIPGMSGIKAHAQTVDTRPFSPIFQTDKATPQFLLCCIVRLPEEAQRAKRCNYNYSVRETRAGDHYHYQ